MLLVTGNKVYGFSNDSFNRHSPTHMRNLFRCRIRAHVVQCLVTQPTTKPTRYDLWTSAHLNLWWFYINLLGWLTQAKHLHVPRCNKMGLSKGLSRVLTFPPLPFSLPSLPAAGMCCKYTQHRDWKSLHCPPTHDSDSPKPQRCTLNTITSQGLTKI